MWKFLAKNPPWHHKLKTLKTFQQKSFSTAAWVFFLLADCKAFSRGSAAANFSVFRTLQLIIMYLQYFLTSTSYKHLRVWLCSASTGNASTCNLVHFAKQGEDPYPHHPHLIFIPTWTTWQQCGRNLCTDAPAILSINTEMSVGNMFAEVTTLSGHWQILHCGCGQWNKPTAGRRNKL